MLRKVLTSLLPAVFIQFSTPSFVAGAEVDEVYQRHCTACHGEKGDGDGPAAYLLYPKPRDFTSGVFKFRSTPTGAPPTDDDLLLTLKRGVSGTSMPSWDRLSESELTDLVAHVKSFSDIFEDEDAMEPPIEIPSPAPASEKGVQAGENIYKELECDKCHGPTGKGDGPSAATLTDDFDRTIRPYDFTRGPGLMKGGSTPQAIYRTFMTGLDGTPMPSFIDELEEHQRWQLVHYIRSLSPASVTPVFTQTPKLQSVSVAVDPSLKVNEAVWSRVPAVAVPLRPLWARDDWVDSVKVQVVIGPKMATFRFRWRDLQQNHGVARTEDFRDGLALQYAPRARPDEYIGMPFIGMGDNEDTVTIWHWKSDWQADMVAGFRDVTQQHGDAMDRMAEAADRSDEVAGLAAGNPMSVRTHQSPVEVLAAKGFGTLTSLSPANQTVAGSGVWQDGEWVVVMQQVLDSDSPLRKKTTLPFAIAAWDGGAGDRDGQKSVSQWLELKIQ
jgi:cytochrome c oxidase cbb3-type subunit 2